MKVFYYLCNWKKNDNRCNNVKSVRMWNGVIMLKKYNIVNNVFLNGILCK